MQNTPLRETMHSTSLVIYNAKTAKARFEKQDRSNMQCKISKSRVSQSVGHMQCKNSIERIL